MDFSNTLIKWYLQNKRDLPWRATPDPYLIWLSEIILQQTRVAQGLPYYYAFAEAFPTVDHLAAASEQDVLKLWQGLGYYSRARNLHKTAKHVSGELGGRFPQCYDELLKLKGVGSYTAAAIASFAFEESVPVVDGNVFRVLSRFFNIATDISSLAAKKEFFDLAAMLMPPKSASDFNQAIMEFGALQCVPKNPPCENCILNAGCLAYQQKAVHLRPVKTKKAKPRDRYLNFLVFDDEVQNTLIRQRTSKGIWQNLYEFPYIETECAAEPHEIYSKIETDSVVTAFEQMPQASVTHKLSHQNLHINFNRVRVEGQLQGGTPREELLQFPFPIVLVNFINKHWK